MRVVKLTGLVLLLLVSAREPLRSQTPRTKERPKASPDGKNPPATPFSAVIRKHFDKWDLDHDGKLTPEEIDVLMVRPAIKGDAAVALAVFKNAVTWAGDKQPPPVFNLEDLRSYEVDKAAGKEVNGDFDRVFASFKQDLAKTPRELFPEKVPKLTALVQAAVMSDCFFLSMLGALVHHRPEEVCRMIEPIDGGKKYTVHFGGTPRPVTIRTPTDAEIALYSSALENGLWLTVLEKAFNARDNRKKPKTERTKVANDAHANHGGRICDAIAILTGHDYLECWDTKSPKLRPLVQASVADGCLIGTCLSDKIKVPPGLISGHVYAVIDFDAKKKTVTIFDPRGHTYQPKGTPGPGNGYEINHGVFTLPWKDFVTVFCGVGVEDKNTKAKY